jgi:hypothetical protein
MKTISIIAALLLANAGTAAASDGKYLNVAILSLPDRYLADIPAANRGRLLEQLSSGPFSDNRLDYGNGWLHWYSDGPSADSPGSTSMFWLKILPVPEGRVPFVFVHMAKPFANGAKPERNQTFVLQRVRDEWKDVTRRVIPEEVDLTMHFRPRRSANIVEAAAYERFERQDGRGSAYRFGKRKFDLVWDDGKFQVHQASKTELSGDDDAGQGKEAR